MPQTETAAARRAKVSAALNELQNIIAARYPNATFRRTPGWDDPRSTYLVTTVDLDDPDSVLDLIIGRLHHFQVEERLPILVVPVRTPERRQAMAGRRAPADGAGHAGGTLPEAS